MTAEITDPQRLIQELRQINLERATLLVDDG